MWHSIRFHIRYSRGLAPTVAEAPEFPLSADPIPLTLAANALYFVPFSIRGDVASFTSVTPQNNG